MLERRPRQMQANIPVLIRLPLPPFNELSPLQIDHGTFQIFNCYNNFFGNSHGNFLLHWTGEGLDMKGTLSGLGVNATLHPSLYLASNRIEKEIRNPSVSLEPPLFI
eukprot:129190_1